MNIAVTEESGRFAITAEMAEDIDTACSALSEEQGFTVTRANFVEAALRKYLRSEERRFLSILRKEKAVETKEARPEERAYFLWRQGGMSWPEIAEELDMKGGLSAERWAARFAYRACKPHPSMYPRPQLDGDSYFVCVETLELSVRADNALRNAGIMYIYQLTRMRRARVLELKNIGWKSFREIAAALKTRGLRFIDYDPEET